MVSIKRWQWIVLSLLIGVMAGFLVNYFEEDPTAGIPNHLEPADVERFANTSYKTPQGEKRFVFRGITVEVAADPRDRTNKPVTKVVKNGTVATLTVADHGYVVGQKVTLSGSGSSDYAGPFTVSKITHDSFDITVASRAPATPTGNLMVSAPPRLMYVIKGGKLSFEAVDTVRRGTQATGFAKNGTSVTLTVPTHGCVPGQKILLSGAKETDYTGLVTVRATTPETVTFDVQSTAPPKPSDTLTITTDHRARIALPACAMVPFGPYKPLDRSTITTRYRPSALQRLFEAVGIKPPDAPDSFLDYLATVQANTGNSFEYHWWAQPRVRIFRWSAGCLIVFGLVFPTLINIMVFGSIFRPKEEKEASVSLRNVKSSATAAPQPKSKVTQQDWDQLKSLEAELEAKLAGNTISDQAPPPPTDFEPAAGGAGAAKSPAKLAATTTEPAAVVPQTDEQKEFAQKAEDFYPVERHQHQRPTDKPH